MPVTADQPAPYAPPSAILEIIHRRRDRGLTAPINADVLARAGVSSSLIPRTLKSLQTLDLINEQGQPTPTFEAIRVAPTPEFQPRMQEWLKNAYADVFAFVDPSQDDEGKITDAFRSYEPAAQQRRMVILFRDLCTAAGLAPQKPAKTEKPSSTRPAARAPTTRPTKAVPAQPNKRATTTLMDCLLLSQVSSKVCHRRRKAGPPPSATSSSPPSRRCSITPFRSSSERLQAKPQNKGGCPVGTA